MATKLVTYTGLLKDIYYSPKEVDTQELVRLVRQAGAIPQQLLPFNGIIHVIDYTQGRHVGLSGSLDDLVGYSPDDLMESGLAFVIDKFHKDDFKVYNELIFPQIVSKLREIPKKEHDDLLFSFNYRLRNSNGTWVHFYQQSCYVTDPVTKLPLYNVGVLTDISPVKRDNCMVFSIDKKSSCRTFKQDKNLSTAYFYPDPEESKLSKREREVLGWLAEGFSSKQIADKLHLSESTVIIHRKNMLKKSNTKNIAELIRYSTKHGLI